MFTECGISNIGSTFVHERLMVSKAHVFCLYFIKREKENDVHRLLIRETECLLPQQFPSLFSMIRSGRNFPSFPPSSFLTPFFFSPLPFITVAENSPPPPREKHGMRAYYRSAAEKRRPVAVVATDRQCRRPGQARSACIHTRAV